MSVQGLPTPTPPVNVQSTHDSLTVTWCIVTNDTGMKVTYELYYQETEVRATAERKLGLTTCESTMGTITGLSPGVEYEVRVRAVIAGKAGDFSPYAPMRTTPISPLVAPSVCQVSPTTVRATVNPPAVVGSSITINSYMLQCYDVTEATKLHTVKMLAPSSQQLAEEIELDPERLYTFKVRVQCGSESIDSASTGAFQLGRGLVSNSQPTGHQDVEMMDYTSSSASAVNMPNGLPSPMSNRIREYDGAREQARMATRTAKQTPQVVKGDMDELSRIKARGAKKLKQEILHESSIVGGTANTPIYQVDLSQVYASKTDMLYKFEVGNPRPGSTEKVIMIVGATGSGKTTLINAMLNYIIGVDFEDKYRLRLIMEDQSAANQAKSQTQNITAYTIHQRDGAKIAYTLTVIDTPGFGDTTGIQRDQLIAQQIKAFFSTKGRGGIDHIDAIGFVVQASLARLTPAQTYVFDAILSLFGNDIADNIFLMVTFADGQKPPVLAGVNEANMTYKKYYKFNNSAVFPDETEEDGGAMDDMGDFNMMFWAMGFKSFEKFLSDLTTVTSKSLQLTKNVLDERNRLEHFVTKIHEDIKHGLNQLEQLRVEIGVLSDNSAEIDRNKDFEYTVVEDIMVKHDTPTGQHTTNCLNCNHTCHENCMIPDDGAKEDCVAIGDDGMCTICPGNCIWNVHKNLPYIIIVEQQQTTKTAHDLKTRYEEACGRKLNAEQLVNAAMQDFDATQEQVLELTEKVRASLKRLQEIALKPNPLSCLDYIDLLIQSEENEGRPGWQDRVKQLRGVRAKAEIVNEVVKPTEFKPFDDYKKCVKEDMDTASEAGSDSCWSTASKHVDLSNLSE